MNINIRVLNTIGIRGAVAFGNFLLPILIAHYYGLKKLGIFVTIVSTITFIHIILKFGMDKTLMREVSKLKNIKKYIFFSFKSFLIIYFFLSSILFVFDKFFNLEYLFYILLTSIPYTVLILNSTILQALGRPDKGLIFNPGLSSLIICMLLLFFNKILNVNIILNIYSSILWAMFFISFFIVIPLVVKQEDSPKLIIGWRKKYLYNSCVFFIISVFVFSQQISLTFTLNYFETIEIVGLVRYAEKLAIIFTFPLMVVVAIFAPKFSYLYSINDIEKLKKTFNKSLIVCFFSTLLCLVVFIIFYYVLSRFQKHDYDNLIYYVIPFVLAQIINLLTGPSDILLGMVGRERLLLGLTIFSGLISILLFYLALKFFTLLIAVYLLNSIYLLRNIFQFYFSKKILKGDFV